MIMQETDIRFPYRRIISLVPSLTELLSDLGLEQEVIGITKFCVHPAKWFKSKTRIGGTKNVNIKKIYNLQPDLIIANKEENVKEQVEELAVDFNVFLTDINSLESALEAIRNIGILTARSEQASILSLKLKAKFKKLKEHSLSSKKFKTAYLIWQNPYMAAGGDTFINDMMTYCGMQNVFSSLNRYPETSLAELKNIGCELLLLSSEPYPFKEKHIPEISNQLPGTKIMLADGEMFSWYGSRLIKAADYFEAFISILTT